MKPGTWCSTWRFVRWPHEKGPHVRGDNPARREHSVSSIAILAQEQRLLALAETGMMDAPAEEAFDRITRLSKLILDAPVSLLTLVDDRRQFFLSQQGLPEPWDLRRETPLSHPLCQYDVVASRRPLIMEDARETPVTAHHPATRDLGMIAYLGVPLESPSGHVLGALCVIDFRPRKWDRQAIEALQDLSRLAMDEISLRLMRGNQDATGATIGMRERGWWRSEGRA
jgi:GAF domain-containing protein